MSYICVLTLSWNGKPAIQESPLRFETEEEALAFGRRMFEPPQSVESWQVKEVKEKANFGYQNLAQNKDPKKQRRLVSLAPTYKPPWR